MDKEVREAAPDREGKRAWWRNKKMRDFTHFLIHKSILLRSVLSFFPGGAIVPSVEALLLQSHVISPKQQGNELQHAKVRK